MIKRYAQTVDNPVIIMLINCGQALGGDIVDVKNNVEYLLKNYHEIKRSLDILKFEIEKNLCIT